MFLGPVYFQTCGHQGKVNQSQWIHLSAIAWVRLSRFSLCINYFSDRYIDIFTMLQIVHNSVELIRKSRCFSGSHFQYKSWSFICYPLLEIHNTIIIKLIIIKIIHQKIDAKIIFSRVLKRKKLNFSAFLGAKI